MKVKANKSFSGFLRSGEPFGMHAGEVRELDSNDTVRELISIGYLQELTSLEKEKVTAGEDKRGKSKRS